MSKLLLDSDVLINLLCGRPATGGFLLTATRQSAPCCSAISVAEVHAGMCRHESEATSALLDGLVILPVTRGVAELAGSLWRRDRAARWSWWTIWSLQRRLWKGPPSPPRTSVIIRCRRSRWFEPAGSASGPPSCAEGGRPPPAGEPR